MATVLEVYGSELVYLMASREKDILGFSLA